MTKNNHDNILRTWLADNSWNLIVTAVLIVLAFATLKSNVQALTVKVDSVQNQVNKYPSEQYFNLKFQTQDEKLVELGKKIDNVQAILSNHLQEK
jgi:hypothetical protein